MVLFVCAYFVAVGVFRVSRAIKQEGFSVAPLAARSCAHDPVRASTAVFFLVSSQDKDDKKSKKSAPRSPPTQLVYDFKKTLRAARKLRDSLDMTKYQLVEMHDRSVVSAVDHVAWMMLVLLLSLASFMYAPRH